MENLSTVQFCIEFGLEMGLGWLDRLELRSGMAGDIPQPPKCLFRAESTDRMFLYNLEKLFLKKPCVYSSKITNRPTQNDRKDCEKFSCFHQKS